MQRCPWLVLACMVLWIGYALAEHSAPVFPARVTASSGQEDFSAPQAMDGNLQTRWSSAFTDNEWWQAEFAQPASLAGVQIRWEQAYAERYTVLISDDGVQWQPVFVETAGDGKTDWIFFTPVTTRFLRLQCQQRATGWGYSIWEVRPLPARDWPAVDATETFSGSRPHHIVDGSPQTAWHSATEHNTIRIDLPYAIELGGVEITWGSEFATAYSIAVTTADAMEQHVARIGHGNGGQDLVYFPATVATRLTLQLEQSAGGQGYALAEIKLKGGDEQATPLRYYQALAQERPRGWYPRWLSREQEFWTISGVPGAAEESLLGESGVFEPYREGFTVMPFVQTAERLFSWADVSLEAALDGGYLPLPSVTWRTAAWSLHVASVAFGSEAASSTAVRYRLSNQGNQALHGQLILVLRPLQLNPQWQLGGFSPIRSFGVVPYGHGQALRINGHDRVIVPLAPTQIVALPLEQGTVLDCLRQTPCPAPASASDAEGKSEAALLYEMHLEPGTSRDVVVVFPLHDQMPDMTPWQEPAVAFAARLQEQRQFWHAILDRTTFSIPEPQLIRMLQSNLAYILLNQDGPWIKPGPRQYNHSWIRDASMTTLALLRMGIIEPVRRFVETYIPLVDARGWVPWIVFDGGKPVEYIADSREGHEYDSQGEFAFLVRNYVDFTGNTTLLEQAYPVVMRALRYGNALRQQRMTAAYRTRPSLLAYFGILPESNSHEGYYPAKHSYWDDFWYLRGLKDGLALATRLGNEADAVWLRTELHEARTDLYASMRRVIARDQLDYLPGSVEKGDFDANSTAIAIMVSDELAYLPQPYATDTFERYYEEFVKRLIPGGARSFTPYEVRNAETFVRLGKRQRALNLLRVLTYEATHPPAWNHLAEVVHGRYRAPSYIGDMPHTWVGSGYISAVRALFAYEEGERLILAAGIDPEWSKDGVQVHHLPTQFGDIHYTLNSAAGVIRLHVWGEATPPGGFLARLPEEWRTMTAHLNGESVANRDASFLFTTLPASLELREKDRDAHTTR